MAKSVEEYFVKNAEWRPILESLRNLMLETEMVESLKWGMPYYTLDNKNIVGIAAFKEHVALWFTQGSFLSDPKNVLVSASEGKTKGQRQIRFTSIEQIDAMLIRNYTKEAIDNHRKGLEIQPDKAGQYELAAELELAFQKDKAFEEAFYRFTPGKQKEFSNHVSEAKREETRLKRVEKIRPMVLQGVDLNAKYR